VVEGPCQTYGLCYENAWARDRKDPPIALMASSVMRHLVAQGGQDGSGSAYMKYKIKGVSGKNKQILCVKSLNVAGFCTTMVNSN